MPEAKRTYHLLGIEADKIIKGCFLFLLVLCSVIILSGFIAMFSLHNGESTWLVRDDAYMYIRYADNIIKYGKASWNPGGDASYGFTSPAYLGIVLPIRLLAPHKPVEVLIASSTICGILFMGLLLFLLVKYMDTSRQVKRAFISLVFVYFAINSSSLLFHFVSGMDTCLALVFITAYIIIIKWHESSPGIYRAVIAGIWGGLAFSVRPDLLLYSFIVPASMYLFTPDRESKKNALYILGTAIIVAGMQTMLAFQYFHSFLPLPFYAKSTGNSYYGYIKFYKDIPGTQLKDYIESYIGFFIIILIGILTNLKTSVRKTSAINKGLLLASGCYIFYYLFFVLQVVFRQFRFYIPTLPPIIFLASQIVAGTIKKIRPSLKEILTGLSDVAWLSVTLLLIIPLSSELRTNLEGTYKLLQSNNSSEKFNLGIMRDNRRYYWFCITEFSRLPDDLVIATTEVGRPACLNPRKTIVDMAGLNDTEFAHHGFSTDILFQKYSPDLIYMPHPHYKQMLDSIFHNPIFIKEYEYFPPFTLNRDVIMGVALKKNSPHYQKMRDIMTTYAVKM